MKNEIRDAYERMNPPREAKERMMKNIMKKQNKREPFYSVKPTPTRRWTAIPAALALICVLVIGWQVMLPGENPAPIATNPGETTATTAYVGLDVLKLDELFPDVPEEYLDIVGNYYSGLKSGTDSTGWEKMCLNPAAYENLNVIDGLGYALMDLDGNGTEELLITDGDQVYDLYAQVDGEVRELLANRIHHQGKRNSIKLCQGNVLMVWQRSAGVDYIHWWRLGKDGLGDIALVCEETVSAGDDGKWYAGPNDKDAVEVTEEEAREIINSREPVFVNYTPICSEKFPQTGIIPGAYGPILEKYITADIEEWNPEQYMAADISYMVWEMDIFQEYGYALIDLDDNGIDELIITDGERIFDIFTIMEEKGVQHILTAGERLRYFLCEDHVVGYRGSSGAANTVVGYYTLKNGMDLVPVIWLQFDTDTWYKSDSGSYFDPHPGPMIEITEDEARHIQESYRGVEIAYEKLLRMELSEERLYPSTYAQLLGNMITLTPEMENLYVALEDVSGDGVAELLLGKEDSFGHVYAIIDGQVENILSYGKDEGFTLCKDGVITFYEPGDPFGYYSFISMKDNEPYVIEDIRYDKEAGSWFRYKTIGKEYLKDYQVKDILASYCPLSVPMIPVAEYLAGE